MSDAYLARGKGGGGLFLLISSRLQRTSLGVIDPASSATQLRMKVVYFCTFVIRAPKSFREILKAIEI